MVKVAGIKNVSKMLGNIPRYVTQHNGPYNNNFIIHRIQRVDTYLH